MALLGLTCKELVELVTDYLEGAMPLEDRLQFEEHIAICPPCRVHLEQMRQTIEILGTLSEKSITPEAERDLLAAFRDWKDEREDASRGAEA